MQLQGKTAFITGGVSGIGFGIARALSAAGMELVLTYRNTRYREAAQQSLEQQKQIELADTLSFEAYRQRYLSPDRLGLPTPSPVNS